MAVRVFKYTVTDDEIAAVSIPQAGVQGEHNATKLEFEMGDSLTQKLMALSGDGKVFCYHFDRYDGTGGKNSTEPIEFTPGADKNFSHLIEQWQTRYGGTIQIYFVITLVDEDKTEMELYSYSVKLMLKSLPEAAETDDENYDTIVTLAMVAKKHSEIATNAAKTATEAMEKTELAKAALEGGSEWVFDGGDASDSIGVDFVVDSEFINGSENPVKSKVVKEYVDKGNENLQKQIDNNKNVGEANQKIIEGMADYIVETGTVGEWTYEKWASGKAECWCVTTPMFTPSKPWGDGGTIYTQKDSDGTATYYKYSLPNIFKSIRTANLNTMQISYIIRGTIGNLRTTEIGYFLLSTVKLEHVITPKISINVKGRWK